MSILLTPESYYTFRIDANGNILEKSTSTGNVYSVRVASGAGTRMYAAAWNISTVDLTTLPAGQVANNIIPRFLYRGYTTHGEDDEIWYYAIPRSLGAGDNIYDYITKNRGGNEIWSDIGTSSVGSVEYWRYDWDSGGAYDGELPEKTAESILKLIKGDYILLAIMHDQGVSSSFTIARYDGSDTSDKSYLEIMTTKGSPVIEGITPTTNSLLNPNAEQKISYTLTAPALITAFDQDSVTGEIVVNEGAAYEKTIYTHETAFTLSPSEMTGETISLRFSADVGGGVSTPTTEWLTYVTRDGTTNAVPLYPVDAFVSTAEPVEFAWIPGVQYGDQATKAVLQYSVDQLLWNSLAEVDGSDSTVIVDLSTLPGGTIYWRVQTYNANGIPGNWSTPAAITLYGPPQTPAIYSITADPRPLITWQSPCQVAYQLQIGTVIDTGEVPGTARSYQVVRYLEKGTYPVRLRIKNNIGVWSAWAESSMEIDFESPAAPDLEVKQSEISLTIKITNWSDYAKAYLIRDGVPVGKFVNGLYVDKTATAEQTYTVIGVTVEDTWAKTTQSVSFEMPGGFTLAPASGVGGDVWMKLMIDRPREVSRVKTYGGAIMHLLGREYGVRQFSGNNQGSFQVEAAMLELSELSVLYALADKHQTVLYRDKMGARVYCAIDQISESDMFKGASVVRVVTITLSRVDFVEEIEFDVPEPLTATALLRMMPQNERRAIRIVSSDTGTTE